MTDPTQPTLVGLFRDEQSLEEAASALHAAGIDRSQLSMLSAASLEHGHHSPAERSEDSAAAAREPEKQSVHSDTDARQLRAMTSGIAGTAGGALAAGIAIISGAAALTALGAAAAAGLGVTAVAHVVTRKAGEGDENALRWQVEHGGIILWVAPKSEEERGKAEAILQRYATKAGPPEELRSATSQEVRSV